VVRIRAQRLDLGPGVWSPSGRSIAVWASSRVQHGRDGIYVERVNGTGMRRITRAPAGRVQRPLAYSRDGTALLYLQHGAGHAGAAYVVRAHGGRPIRITPAGMTSWCCYFGSPASWGPGNRVAIAAFAPGALGRGGESAVFVVSADGSGRRRITTWNAWTTSAHWSPDGRRIVFDRVNRPGGAHDLVLVRPDGTGLRILDSGTAESGSCCAVWSPNGRELLYQSGADQGHLDLYTLNLDGTGIRRLTHADSGYAYTWTR
jgi:TolB protein